MLRQIADLFGTHPLTAEVKAGIIAADAFKKAVQFERFAARYRPSAIVFNGLETASAWLGISAEDAEQRFQQLQQAARGQAPQPRAA